MEKRRIALQGNSLGIEPEMALVLKTVGTVENFLRVVKNIEGLNWLGEHEVNDIFPSHGFEDSEYPHRNLKGRLFLVMSDSRALTELKSLFDSWDKDSESSFSTSLAPLKKVFKCLHQIRHWNVEDRLSDTGLLEDWENRIRDGQENVIFEAELWYSSDLSKRQENIDLIRNLVNNFDGQVISECIIENIAYHAVLGQIDISHVSNLLTRPEARKELALFKCDQVMFFRPLGQCAAPIPGNTDEEAYVDQSKYRTQTTGNPVIALLDGMPLTQHKLLDGRLMIDDPDEYEEVYQARERSHGTAMASLICHGDVNSMQLNPLKTPIYVRPIMQPRRGFDDKFNEVVPDNVLPVDLVHRAVVRMFDGEGGEPAVSPDVRVVCLSVGDPARPFWGEMSGWARLLDWLSWKYNVLFIVSAGNHNQDISLNTVTEKLNKLAEEERQKLVISALAEDTVNRRLLSPSETINGVTVGSLHTDESDTILSNYLIDPVINGMPSVISAHGPGYRQAIKPEIYLPGGRQLLLEKPVQQDGGITVRPIINGEPPGQKVATPGQRGTLNAERYTRGTSNATALGVRQAYLFFELIEILRIQSEVSIPKEFDAVLMKTLLVHGAHWGEMFSSYKKALHSSQNSRRFKDYVTRFIGYGQPDFTRVMEGEEKRVTVIGYGLLSDGKAAEFSLPLPPSLFESSPKMRVIITLGWFSPINSRHQKYRIAHLWFDRPKRNVSLNRLEVDYRAVQRGTIQHEIFEGSVKESLQDGNETIIKINCRKEVGEITNSIRFGLAVTVEIIEDILFPVPIYEEIRNRLSARIQTPIEVFK